MNELKQMELISRDLIYSYLTPHPLNEDGDYEDDFISWLPGFNPLVDEESGLPAYLGDENIALYRSIEEYFEGKLHKAMANLWPLLKDHCFKSVQLGLDVTGILLSSSSLAAYNHMDSKPEKGLYVLIVSQNLLHRHLICSSEGRTLDFHDEYTLEHELIHLLDHWQMVISTIYENSSDANENLKYCMLMFRMEGIADLHYLLNANYLSINSIEEAKRQTRQYFSDLSSKMEGKIRTDYDTRKDMYSSKLCYYAGPWLILDMLCGFEGGWFEEKIHRCIDSISQGTAVDHETILEVVRFALRIDCISFLEYFEKLLDDSMAEFPLK